MKKGLIVLIVFLLMGCQPKLTPEEARAKWQSPLAISALNFGTCTTATETAKKVHNGQIDGFEAWGELLGIGMMIQVVDEGLAEAEPTEDQVKVYTHFQEDIDAFKAVIGPWLNEETTVVDVLANIDAVCIDMEKTFEEVVEAAADDGLPPEEMEAILDEMSSAMESVTDELE